MCENPHTMPDVCHPLLRSTAAHPKEVPMDPLTLLFIRCLVAGQPDAAMVAAHLIANNVPATVKP